LEGEATGEQTGCAFRWKYTRDVPQADGKSTRLNFDDWFYAIDIGDPEMRPSSLRRAAF
jgi:hypothetical protein